MDKEIEEMIKNSLNDQLIGEDDVETFRVLLTWSKKGRAEADQVNAEIVQALIDNGFANEEFLLADMENLDTWFLMAISGAKGLIQQDNG